MSNYMKCILLHLSQPILSRPFEYSFSNGCIVRIEVLVLFLMGDEKELRTQFDLKVLEM